MAAAIPIWEKYIRQHQELLLALCLVVTTTPGQTSNYGHAVSYDCSILSMLHVADAGRQ